MKRMLIGLGLIAIAGCAPMVSGREIDDTAVKRLKSGVSTKPEVVGVLGQPMNRIVQPGKKETWTYIFTKSDTKFNAAFFVPFVGAMLPGSTSHEWTSKRLMISFENDVVTKCEYTVTGGKSDDAIREGLGGGGTTTTPCGDE